MDYHLGLYRLANELLLLGAFISILGTVEALLILVSLPDATAILVGVGLLAPIFVLQVAKDIGIREGRANLFFRSRHWAAMFYWFATVVLFIQYIFFIVYPIPDLSWYFFPIFDLGLFFFVCGNLSTLAVIWASENTTIPWHWTVLRTALILVIGALYAERITFAHEITTVGQYRIQGPGLFAGLASYVVFLAMSLRHESRWNYVPAVIALIIVILSDIFLHPSLPVV